MNTVLSVKNKLQKPRTAVDLPFISTLLALHNELLFRFNDLNILLSRYNKDCYLVITN